MSNSLLSDRIIRQSLIGSPLGRSKVARDEQHATRVVQRLMFRLKLMTKVRRFAARGVVRDSVREERIHPLRVNGTLMKVVDEHTPEGWTAIVSYSRPFGSAMRVELQHKSSTD